MKCAFFNIKISVLLSCQSSHSYRAKGYTIILIHLAIMGGFINVEGCVPERRSYMAPDLILLQAKAVFPRALHPLASIIPTGVISSTFGRT